MNNWKEVSLKSISKRINYGYTASSTTENTGVKFLRITDIAQSNIDWSTVPYCPISDIEFERNKLKNGDIVIARTGATVGYAKQIRNLTHKSVFASYLVRFQINEGINSKFIGVIIESDVFKNYIQSIAGGSAQPNANSKDLGSFKFFLPPLSEQQRIASILSAYDDLIEVNNKRIALLEQMAEQIYKEWFVRMRFPGYQDAEFEKGVPKGWEVKKINQVVTTQYGFTASSEVKSADGVKFLRITDIASSKIDWDNVPDCSINVNEMKKYLLHAGDIVVARTGATAGYAKRLHKLHPVSVFASYLVRLKTKDERLNIYIGIIVQSNTYKEYIQSIAGGSAQPQANAQVLTEMSILIPKMNLLEAFNKIVEPMLDESELLDKQNSILKQTRDLLLPRLISGKLRV